MALPKEPRQKMINLMYLVLVTMLALNVSSKVIEAFKTVDKSLMTSNNNIEASNGTIFKSLVAKLSDPQVDKAKLAKWTDAANKAKKLSEDFDGYLNGLKKELKEGSNLRVEDGVEKFKEDDLNASSRIFDNQHKGKELDDKLKAYKTAMLAIDPEIAASFKENFPVEVDDTKDGTTPNFRMMPTVAAITLLSKYENNIKNTENQVVTLCHNKIGEVKVVYDKFAAIVGQSSNYVMPGEKVSITAGVGAYSVTAQPEITIGGASVPVSADGVATKEFNADGAGPKSVPVNVTYTKPDGTKETKTYELKYTVGTPGGAAVMLDKMNVFYIGVDNPVTISSGKGWDKTTANGSGCTLSGSGSNRIVRVSGGTTCSIVVTAEGSAPKPFNFRIKRIPDPVFKIGDGKSRMPAVAFKNQQYCRADLENFDFDLKFSIVSATVYFGGANFQNPVPATINGNNLSGVSNLIQRCGPGSSISFENIKVSGPDGVRTIDGRSFQLY